MSSRSRPPRLPQHAASYLGSGDALERNLEEILDLAEVDAPGAQRSLVGLVSPHIDLPRGWAGYGAAFAQLRDREPADVYVVLGTSHSGLRASFTGTVQDFATPFGTLPVDRDLVRQIERSYGQRFLAEADAHVAEHSIEFQTLFLGLLFGGLPPGQRPRLLPVLCSTRRGHTRGESLPWQDPEIVDFIAAARDALAGLGGNVCVIAGVDLSHMGPDFGGAGVSAAEAEALAARDVETVQLACAGDSRGFWRDVVADRNARQICGLAPMYTQLELLKGRVDEAVALHYGQAVDDARSVVSYAAAAFYGS